MSDRSIYPFYFFRDNTEKFYRYLAPSPTLIFLTKHVEPAVDGWMVFGLQGARIRSFSGCEQTGLLTRGHWAGGGEESGVDPRQWQVMDGGTSGAARCGLEITGSHCWGDNGSARALCRLLLQGQCQGRHLTPAENPPRIPLCTWGHSFFSLFSL